jgi:hypothetical protein
MKVTRAKMAE